MSYPGNASLSREVQERILGSFRQTLDLVAAGNDREALLGCEFILGMDPLFVPASTLLERLNSDVRPISTRDLQASVRPSGDAGEVQVAEPDLDPLTIETSLDSIGDLGDLDLDDLESIDDLEKVGLDTSPAVPPAPASPAGTQPATGLGALLQDLLDKSNYDQVLQIAQSQRAVIEADPDLLALVQTAETQVESARYVESFLAQAEAAHTEGRIDDARRLISKARVLDPNHPKIRPLDATLQATGADDAAAAGLVARPTSEMAVGSELEAPQSTSNPLDTGPILAIPDELEPLDIVPEVVADAPPEPRTPPSPEAPAAPVAEVPTADVAAPADAAAPSDDSDQGRINALLEEGQKAFDGGDYQAAIDVWSRIFLIDIDNDEASNRIDDARNRRAELERQAEEVFHEGLKQVESQDLDRAKASFARVLELQPGHTVAREYLDQLEAGEVPVTARPDSELSSSATLDFETDDERDRSLEAAVERDRVVVVKKTDKRLLGLGVAVLVVLLGSLGFLVLKWNDLFPNADDFDSSAPVVANQVGRATALHERGNTETAIRILEKVPANDPQHTQAQALLAQWRALIEAPPEIEEPTGPSEEELRRRAGLVDSARIAVEEGRNLAALAALEQASQVVPLDADESILQRNATREVDALRDELEMVEQGQWERALPNLWRRYDADSSDQDSRQLIVECYYNLALRSLQRGDAKDGADKLREAAALEPGNATIERLTRFADAYAGRSQDMLYRIFVKYLPPSP